jgi:hypothetical protein
MRFRFSSRLFVRGEAVPLHSHASAEAFCVLTGTIEFFRVVAGEQDRMCCETGALMIVPPNAFHALRNNTSQTRSSAWHLRRMLRAYLAYYHRSRTHLGLDKDAPDRRPASSGAGPIVVTPEVGGLHHRYDRQAA